MPKDANSAIYASLRDSQASLSPKLFYDKLGSILFTAICEVPEYYPTRTEATIFCKAAADIAARLKRPFRMVDLGAGDCRKAAGLFEVLKPSSYTPVDISGEFLQEAAADLQRKFPLVKIEPLVRDFTQEWALPDAMLAGPLLFFYPGSSISNFTPEEAAGFLRRLKTMGGSQSDQQRSLLIGVDLIKDAAVLEAAYDDALGVTAAFNRNMLLNANRLAGTDFDVSQWEHRALFNTQKSRIEMHLEAREDLTVTWPGGQRAFQKGESIHTENSYKWSVASFDEVLQAAGFVARAHYQDEQHAFMVVLADAG